MPWLAPLRAWMICCCSFVNLSKLLACTVDVDQWSDYKPEAARPFGNKPVALGYDPSRTRDNASLAALGIPIIAGEAWRVLRTDSYHGQNFQFQSNRIKDVRNSHNVQHIGIDIFSQTKRDTPNATFRHHL
ncbi:hypothetical protein [Candidatus Methylobacter oryzae]|nr:hypothetical protein [Candidatus Methylobacter oryzae]